MKFHLGSAIPGLLLLAGCVGPPRLTDSWRDPSVKEFSSHKTFVLAVSEEESFRRVAEDELARHLPQGTAVASYTLVSANDAKDPQKVLEFARGQGFDSALVMRILDVDKLQQQVPSAYTPVFVYFPTQGNGMAYYYPTRYDEGYTYTEKTYRVETSLYELADAKLVWSGVAQVRDPDSTRELVANNSVAVTDELRKQGLIR